MGPNLFRGIFSYGTIKGGVYRGVPFRACFCHFYSGVAPHLHSSLRFLFHNRALIRFPYFPHPNGDILLDHIDISCIFPPPFFFTFFQQDPSPVGRLPPFPFSYEGTWHYHWPLQRQRLEYNFYEESRGSVGAVERKEKTLVELWRGHEEVYVFSPTDRSCRLLDLWPDFTPLSPHWLNGHGTGKKKGREALYRGRAYDVMRSVQNGSEVLVEVERWEGGAEGGVGTAVPGMVAYFLSPPREDPGKVVQETRGKVDVTLRLLGPVPGWGEGGEEGREGGREEAVRVFSFSDFSTQPPSENLFVLPSYCRNASVVVLPQDVGEGG